jgi:hypothetical protein
MRTARLLVLALAPLMIPLAASAAPPPTAASVTAPSLDTFLSSLKGPEAAPAAQAAASCGTNFCTTVQRDACTQQCLSHPHHGPFVGLECCADSCTTLCICGSVPVAC